MRSRQHGRGFDDGDATNDPTKQGVRPRGEKEGRSVWKSRAGGLVGDRTARRGVLRARGVSRGACWARRRRGLGPVGVPAGRAFLEEVDEDAEQFKAAHQTGSASGSAQAPEAPRLVCIVVMGVAQP